MLAPFGFMHFAGSLLDSQEELGQIKFYTQPSDWDKTLTSIIGESLTQYLHDSLSFTISSSADRDTITYALLSVGKCFTDLSLSL